MHPKEESYFDHQEYSRALVSCQLQGWNSLFSKCIYCMQTHAICCKSQNVVFLMLTNKIQQSAASMWTSKVYLAVVSLQELQMNLREKTKGSSPAVSQEEKFK